MLAQGPAPVLILLLVGRVDHRADRRAQYCRGAQQADGLLRCSLGERQVRQALQAPGDAALVANLLPDLQAFRKVCPGALPIPFPGRRPAQCTQRYADTPFIAKLPPEFQAFFQQPLRTHNIPLAEGDLTQA